jgi:hypothetical protein
LTVVGVFGAGVAIGVAGMALLLAYDGGAAARRLAALGSAGDLAHRPTRSLGRELMGRVGDRFVHDTRRPGSSLANGVGFFDQPKPYGSWLCRVNLYYVHPRIVAGKAARDKDFWDDDLEVRRLYGVWKRPTAPDDPKLDRDAACARYDDFDHLFSEDDLLAAERGVYLLDVASQAARTGKPPFALTCVDQRRKYAGEPCDGLPVLAAADLKKIRQVADTHERRDDEAAYRTDTIYMAQDGDIGGHPVTTAFVIQSVQRFGKNSVSEGDVVSVEVRREVW